MGDNICTSDNTQQGLLFASRDTVEEKLHRMEKLPPGWHFGEGVPISPDAIKSARQLYKIGKAHGFLVGVFPHEDGDVSIMFKAGNRYLEVLCLPDGTFSFTLEEGDGHPFALVREQENVPLSIILIELDALPIQESSCDSSDSFTPISTILISGDSPLYVLETQQSAGMIPRCQQARGESRSSMLTVSAADSPLNPSANTSQNDTKIWGL